MVGVGSTLERGHSVRPGGWPVWVDSGPRCPVVAVVSPGCLDPDASPAATDPPLARNGGTGSALGGSPPIGYRRPMSATRTHSSASTESLEAGAGCVSSACSNLCGGYRATGIPTATLRAGVPAEIWRRYLGREKLDEVRCYACSPFSTAARIAMAAHWLRLNPSACAAIAAARWYSGGSRSTNFPE